MYHPIPGGTAFPRISFSRSGRATGTICMRLERQGLAVAISAEGVHGLWALAQLLLVGAGWWDGFSACW